MNEAKWTEGLQLQLLERAMKKGIEVGIFNEAVVAEEYLRNWQGMIAILEELGVVEMYEALEILLESSAPYGGSTCEDGVYHGLFLVTGNQLTHAADKLAKARGEL